MLRKPIGVLIAALLLPGGAPALARPAGLAGPEELRLAVRSGDPAPVTARLRGAFHCGPAAVAAGVALVDAAGTAVYLRDALGLRPLAHAGDEAAPGARLKTIGCPAAGLDGDLTVPAILADDREAIVGLDADGLAPRALLSTGATVDLRDGPGTVAFLWGHAGDAGGAVILPVNFAEGATALLKVEPGGGIEVLAQAGDALGPGRIAAIAGARPAVNRAGTVVFAATLETGETVLASRRAGEGAVILFLAPPGAFQALAPQGPAIDDAGNIAFAWFDHGVPRLQQIVSGLSRTVAFPGAPVAGGGTVMILAPVEPVPAPAGEVVFGAVLADGREGILAAGPDSLRSIVLTGDPIGDGAALEGAPIALRPAVGPEGEVLFAGRAGGGEGVLRVADGAADFAVRTGDVIDGAARFASFLESRTQFLGAGPSLAPGGAMIFDARVTGGGRGLFARDRAGALASIALGGDPAPGGGVFADDVFSFHSINSDGTYVFLGTSGAPPDAAIALFHGRRGAGPATRVAAVGPYMPRSGGAGGGASYAAVPPPSRVNRAGQVAFTFRNGDGSDVLACYDGSSLHFLAAPGHPVSEEDRIALIFTGSFFLGTPLPPHLDDAGDVLFGALTEGGDAGLFRVRCAPGGGGAAVRAFGAGDEVEGGRLSPFELQAFDADAAGRIAFQAVYSAEFDFGLFLREGGATRAVARRFDLVPDIGFLFALTPRLALLRDGRLAFGAVPFAGTEALLMVDPSEGPEPRLLAGRDTDAPDGGRFRDFQASGGPGAISRTSARLASDGAATLAFAASTTAGPEGIFLSGAQANGPPVADAGPRQTAECAGPDGTEILLDGRGSLDPDGDPLIWTWTGPFGIAGGPQPSVRLPLGSHHIRLVVSDGQIDSEPAEVVVDVLDTRPPVVVLGASPATLWPPDGRLVDVGLTVEAADLCDARPRLLLLSVLAGEPPLPGRPGPLIGGADLGTDDRSITLRAERSGTADGRTYTVTYGVIDASDNAAMTTATVVVPHDQARR